MVGDENEGCYKFLGGVIGAGEFDEVFVRVQLDVEGGGGELCGVVIARDRWGGWVTRGRRWRGGCRGSSR